ncbi:hypothetical protein [Enterovibrio norvegicus]|uniref:hypothetical protein n=1 Tax=Enterovibrio norvegicus TaxID=188144 RepID=UPI000301496F|nr:hypothetical protein [Enterovibrio norvegicus]OEF58806.1 hypothetical protein A1OU_11665 [Enterovibrio norvegicus]
MYTLSEWQQICSKISKRKIVTSNVIDAFRKISVPGGELSKTLIIKHDVECRPDLALKCAQIEHDQGITATYYFHGFFNQTPEHVEIMQRIQSLGHEVGFHYDVLDLCDGDYIKANALFSKTLEDFRLNGINIYSICPHGNPLKVRCGWNSNKDFFKDVDIANSYPHLFDIVNGVNVFDNVDYYSDAGYALKSIGDIRDNDKPSDQIDVKVSLDEVLDKDSVSILSVHTHRLCESKLVLRFVKARFGILRFSARLLSKSKFIKKLLSPLYTLTKRF